MVNNLVSLLLHENDFEDENRKMHKKNNSGISRGRALVQERQKFERIGMIRRDSSGR